MPYRAKERLHLNDADQIVPEDDPRVARLLAIKGGTIPDEEAERLGLTGAKELEKTEPASAEPPATGQTYYELTGQEPPVVEGAEPVEEPPPAEPKGRAQPEVEATPPPAASAPGAPTPRGRAS